MNKGIGIDITHIDRFVKEYDSLAARILSKEELSFIEKEPLERKIVFLAGRFSLKEAFFKATGKNISYKELSFLNKENGEPYCQNYPNLMVSLSHDVGLVVSVVINLDS